MKKLVYISVILLFFPLLSSAQEDSLKKYSMYKTRITLGGGSELKGTIYQIGDSSILLANTYLTVDLLTPKNVDINKINYDKIYLITCRNKNNIWRGALVGMVTGVLTGVILGHIIGDSDDPMEWFSRAEEKAVLLGTLFAIPGAVTGVIVTDISFTIKIPIYGNFEKFNENKNRLKKYSYPY